MSTFFHRNFFIFNISQFLANKGISFLNFIPKWRENYDFFPILESFFFILRSFSQNMSTDLRENMAIFVL